MTSEPCEIPRSVPADQEGRSGVASPRNYQGAFALSTLDRLGCGYLVVEHRRRIVEANAAARLILRCKTSSGEEFDQLTSAFMQLLARAPHRPPLGPLCWVVIWNQHEAPFVLNQAADAIPHDSTSLVMLVDLDAHLRPNPFMLQRMFGLTTAETRLALLLANGDLPVDVARKLHLSRSTVRSQLSALFAKTNTKRQAELVTLLARVAVLP